MVVEQHETSTRWHLKGVDVCKNCWILSTFVTPYKLKNHFRTIHNLTEIIKISGRTSVVMVWFIN